MIFIAKDHQLFEELTKNIYIISSSIIKFSIYTTAESGLVIEIDFELCYGKHKNLKLRLTQIKQYSFNWSSEYAFYNVETYKLLKAGNSFYLSFNPEDEAIQEVSENDQDFILFNNFEGYFFIVDAEN